jgi:hypothetical protein
MKRLTSLVCKTSALALVFAGTLGNASPTQKALNVGDSVFRDVGDWREHNTRGQVPHSRVQGLDSGSGHHMVSAQKGGNVFLVLPVRVAPTAEQRVPKGVCAGDLIGTVFRSGPQR